MLAFLLAVHILSAVFWVGGMAFAHSVLRPAAGALESPMRLPLWRRVFQRFLPWVGISIILLLVSGFWMILMSFGGFAGAALYINLMMAVGIVMMLIFAHLYFAVWPRFRRAVDGGVWPDAAKAIDQNPVDRDDQPGAWDRHHRHRRDGKILVRALPRTFSQREKVAAEQPDEGIRRLGLALCAASPHPSPSATPSPYGRGMLALFPVYAFLHPFLIVRNPSS